MPTVASCSDGVNHRLQWRPPSCRISGFREGEALATTALGQSPARSAVSLAIPLKKQIYKNRYYYLLLIPAIAYFILFHYKPMYGVLIAFKDYRMMDGILGSPWAGFHYFERLFSSPLFYRVFRNTVIISVLRIVFAFPAPILLALLLNEIRHVRYKKIVQTISYLPHFISWVVIDGMLREILSPSYGAVTDLQPLQSTGLRSRRHHRHVRLPGRCALRGVQLRCGGRAVQERDRARAASVGERPCAPLQRACALVGGAAPGRRRWAARRAARSVGNVAEGLSGFDPQAPPEGGVATTEKVSSEEEAHHSQGGFS